MFKVKLIGNGKIPSRATKKSAGYDLYSAEQITLDPWSRKLCNTDLSIELEDNVYGRIAPRSGLSVKGIDIGAGVIDSDYTGLIKVLLINNTDLPFEIKQGDRIAQLILELIINPDPLVVTEIRETERSSGGFGSTGV